MKTETEHRQDMVEVGRRLWQRGYVAANDGNISIRLANDEILVTPGGLSKGFLSADQIVKVNLAGEHLAGHLRASSETLMHLEIYKARCDVCAIVHAHPPVSTGFAIAGVPLTQPTLPEAVVNLGGVPLAPYGRAGTPELPAALRPYLEKHDAILLANHGAVTMGGDVYQAYYRLEIVEHFAYITFVARTLGQENVLGPERVAEMEETRQKLGLAFPRACVHCGGDHAPAPAAATDGDDLAEVVRRVTQRVLARL